MNWATLLVINMLARVSVEDMLGQLESGFANEVGEETRAKLEEMKFLDESIGTTGKLAIKPFLQMSRKDLWQFYVLSK